MKIIKTSKFSQIDNQKITPEDSSFCLTPLVSVFETSYLNEIVGEGDYKMVIQAYIPEESNDLTLDTSAFDKLTSIDTPVGKIDARWIKVRYNQSEEKPKFYNLWTCEILMQSPKGDIDCAFYTYTVTNDNDDPRTKRGTVTTVRNSGTGG